MISVVSDAEIENKVKKHQFDIYKKTSAKTGEGVNQVSSNVNL